MEVLCIPPFKAISLFSVMFTTSRYITVCKTKFVIYFFCASPHFWYVALNMVYSDYYRVIMNITGSNNTKHYVEFAKAWLNDKDIDEGKMWYYYIYVMCDKIREAEMECYEEELEKHEGEEEPYGMFRRGSRGGRGRRGMYTYCN